VLRTQTIEHIGFLFGKSRRREGRRIAAVARCGIIEFAAIIASRPTQLTTMFGNPGQSRFAPLHYSV
jgi:hypothetical protein